MNGIIPTLAVIGIIDNYNYDVRNYNYEVDSYINELQNYPYEAEDYVRCEINNLNY